MSFRRGDKKIPASLLNDAADLARARQRGEFSRADNQRRIYEKLRDGGQIVVQNLSGYDLAAGDLCVVKSPYYVPTYSGSGTPFWPSSPVDDAESQRVETWIMKPGNNFQGFGNCDPATRDPDGWCGVYALLLDKCKDGEMAPAKMRGRFLKQVTFLRSEHRYAIMTDDFPGQTLESHITGPFRIISRDLHTPATFPQTEWAVLELNSPFPQGPWQGRNNSGSTIRLGSSGVVDILATPFSGTLYDDLPVTNVGNAAIPNGSYCLVFLQWQNRVGGGFKVYL